LHRRGDGDVHLAAPAEDIGGLVLVDRDDHGVGRGRLGEALQLLPQRDDLLPGVLERSHETLVLRADRRGLRPLAGELVLQLAQLGGGRCGGPAGPPLPPGAVGPRASPPLRLIWGSGGPLLEPACAPASERRPAPPPPRVSTPRRRRRVAARGYRCPGPPPG